MLEKGKISSKQLQWLIIITITSSAMLFLPSVMIEEAKQDAWLSTILNDLFGLLTGYIIIKLGERFPNQTIISYSQSIVGKFLGKLIAFLYILFFTHITAVIVREFGEVAVSVFLTQTPILLMMGSIMIVAASAVRNGIEVIARVNELVFVSIAIFIGLIFLLILPDADFSNLHPILANGLAPILKGAYPGTLFLAEIAILIIIFPAVNKPKKAFNAVLKAILIIIVIGVVLFSEIIAVFGPIDAGQLQIPLLSLARYIEVFDFLERIDPLVVATWFGGGLIKISVFYYCLAISTAEFFELKSYKPVVLPLGVIIIVLSVMLFGNEVELGKIIFESIPPYYLFLETGLPLLLLLVVMIRGIDKRQK